MAAILHPLRTFRENLRVIGDAVNASRAFSSAADVRAEAHVAFSGIHF